MMQSNATREIACISFRSNQCLLGHMQYGHVCYTSSPFIAYNSITLQGLAHWVEYERKLGYFAIVKSVPKTIVQPLTKLEALTIHSCDVHILTLITQLLRNFAPGSNPIRQFVCFSNKHVLGYPSSHLGTCFVHVPHKHEYHAQVGADRQGTQIHLPSHC